MTVYKVLGRYRDEEKLVGTTESAIEAYGYFKGALGDSSMTGVRVTADGIQITIVELESRVSAARNA